MVSLGQTIVRRRSQLGITQGELAKRAKLDRVTVSNAELDKGTPNPITLGGLERGLDLPSGTLFALVSDGARTDNGQAAVGPSDSPTPQASPPASSDMQRRATDAKAPAPAEADSKPLSS